MPTYQSSGVHPLPIPDPYAAGPIRRPTIDERLAEMRGASRCRYCWMELDHAAAFCSSICQMRFEEQLRIDERPVGENIRCNCGLCRTIKETP